MFDVHPEGATPVDPDEAAELLPGHVQTRDELNSWEQANIVAAAEWIQRTRKTALDEPMVREVHRRMFDRTWTWAGRYRTSDKNIGVYWAEVPVEVRKLIEDGQYWLDHGTFPIDEAVLRLHHRLVKIHPFPNGNGRLGRLWCDLLLRQNDRQPFQWKSEQLDQEGDARQRYIHALRRADVGSLEELFALFLVAR